MATHEDSDRSLPSERRAGVSHEPIETLSTPGQMRNLIERVKAHLGPRYSKLKHPHRLVAAVSQLQLGIERFEQMDLFNARAAPALIELIQFDRIASYWADDPEWPRFVKGIADPHKYMHDVVTLSFVHSWRIEAGVTAHLNPEDRRPSPDAFVTVEGRDERLGVEVKVPKLLSQPRTSLTEAEANTCVQRTVADADEQLRRLDSAMLVVGAFDQTPLQTMTVAYALKQWLSDHGPEHPHLAALMLVSVAQSAHHDDLLTPAGDLPPRAVLRTSLHWRLVQNPAYTGGFELLTSANR